MNKLTSKIVLSGILYAILISTTLNSFAQDAQWRGPNRDGKFIDTLLLKEWPKEGPTKLFVTNDLGKSYSSVIASKDKIYTTGIKDSSEYISCLDLQGNVLWQKSYGQAWKSSFPDARCTPTLDNDKVYVLSPLDNLVCMNAHTGELVWEVNIHETYKSDWDMFGVSESVLIHGDFIYTTPAGTETTVIKLNKHDGSLVWKSESLNTKRSNMSPLIINHCGQDYLITATKTHLISVDIQNGDILWKEHYNFLQEGNNTTILANTPIYKDSCLWVSNGWDVKSVMLEIAPDGKSVKEKFADHTFDNQNHGQILHDGFVYGSNFTGRQSGKWLCMNWNTGEITWIEDFHNKGPIAFADDMLYIIDEKRGNVGLVEPSPKEFKLKGSFKVKDGKGPFWSRPAIYNGVLYIRHGDVLIAYDVKQNQK
jgi:outer membrane protein assembly factor BamB